MKRAKLLADLEQIVGDNCYNGHMQNWGPNGVQYGDGRSFRYPLTTVDQEGNKSKFRSPAKSITPEELSTGYYAFGANRLGIITALDEILRRLESDYDLKL